MAKTSEAKRTGRPKAQDAPVTVEQILDAAFRAFATYGYDGVAVRTLNRELGVSHIENIGPLAAVVHAAATGVNRPALELEDNRGKPLHETLSDREYQVMWMIASGKTVRQIADELFLSPNTVSTHRTRILRKMNMKSNAELMHYAIAHHLVD